MPNFKYAIKKIQKRNQECIFVPMIREQSKIKLINLNEWERILKIYNTYQRSTNYVDADFGLTYEDCVDHIEGWKEQLRIEEASQIENIEIILEEDIELKVSLT